MTLSEGPEVVSLAEAPPEGEPKLGIALGVIALAQLMLVLDATIVGVALPSIRSSLDLAAGDLSWVMSAYLLTFGGLLLVGGRLGDIFGRRKVFSIGLVIFTIASLIGGLATAGAVLIGARALQGVGAALTAPTALSLLASTFPAGPARNKAMGVYGAVGGLGSVVGLVLGGVLTEYLSWRWVLYVNIPIAVVVLLGVSVLREGEREQGGIDLPGAIAVTLGLGSLIYAINEADKEGWASGRTIGLLAVALVLLIVFLVIQLRSRSAMLTGRLFHDRGRIGSILVMLLVGGGMAATFYFLTLYMQVVKGYTPMQCAMAYLPFAVGMVISAGGVGPQLLAKTSERSVALLGLALATVGTFWFAALGPTTSAWAVLLPAQLVAGFGLGLSFVTATIVGVRGVAPQDTGIAAGLINTGQQVGGALGLSVLAAIALATLDGGEQTPALLTDSYTVGFIGAALLYLVSAIAWAVCVRPAGQQQQQQQPA
ncbi:DHA2 family efflux MFS transporter permease subunit [Kitasatospora sp. NPDC058444]|uniref:DHA2 family efflux MFS transporter permease subunit n=1 Tax=Kitasatospora sp. NPDC058444 TaxID=3346504 RepID=UPI0036650344